MINNPQRQVPICHFRKENAYSEGETGQQMSEAGPSPRPDFSLQCCEPVLN